MTESASYCNLDAMVYKFVILRLQVFIQTEGESLIHIECPAGRQATVCKLHGEEISDIFKQFAPYQ
jgi:hypothetical protein